MSEQRKTLRSFYCEEDIWKAFEAKAKDGDTTIDAALNAALRAALEGKAVVTDGRTVAGGIKAIDGSARPQPPAAAAQPPAAPEASAPPAAPAAATPPAAPAPSAAPTLFVSYDGKSYAIQKDRFVIGRGSQGTDLMIRDGNISRRHAAIVLHTGSYYIQDLGSTNGIEYRGSRIEGKKVEEGDIFSICSHELTFSFR